MNKKQTQKTLGEILFDIINPDAVGGYHRLSVCRQGIYQSAVQAVISAATHYSVKPEDKPLMLLKHEPDVPANLFSGPQGESVSLSPEKTIWTPPPPPAGMQYHRDDWGQSMLPDGFRPCLLGEKPVTWEDEYLIEGKWRPVSSANMGHESGCKPHQFHVRTRRPLPQPETEEEKERKRFEEWAKLRNFDLTKRSDGLYKEDDTVIAWSAWQAAKKSTP